MAIDRRSFIQGGAAAAAGVGLAGAGTALAQPALLTPEERRWVDEYHGQVLEIVAPQLESEVRTWLEEQCRPL